MIRKYKGVVLHPVIAPYQDIVRMPHIMNILKKKYGDIAKHLDRVFDRWYINHEYVPVIRGDTVYGAIKRALNQMGKPMRGVYVWYAMLDEEDIYYDRKSIVNAKGQQTLRVVEILRPGAEITIVGNLEKLKKDGIKKLTIQVGGARKHGYGIIELILE